jgi:hypothetical protein
MAKDVKNQLYDDYSISYDVLYDDYMYIIN